MSQSAPETAKAQRVYERFPCRIRAQIKTMPSGESFPGELLDIGMGGAYLRTAGIPDSEAEISFVYAGQPFTLYGYIIRKENGDPRSSADTRYAVEFQPYPDTLADLSRLIDRLAPPQQPPL